MGLRGGCQVRQGGEVRHRERPTRWATYQVCLPLPCGELLSSKHHTMTAKSCIPGMPLPFRPLFLSPLPLHTGFLSLECSHLMALHLLSPLLETGSSLGHGWHLVDPPILQHHHLWGIFPVLPDWWHAGPSACFIFLRTLCNLRWPCSSVCGPSSITKAPSVRWAPWWPGFCFIYCCRECLAHNGHFINMCRVNELHLLISGREGCDIPSPFLLPLKWYIFGVHPLWQAFTWDILWHGHFYICGIMEVILGSWVLCDINMKNISFPKQCKYTTGKRMDNCPLIPQNNNEERPLIHATTWVNLENITLSERRQTQKNTQSMIPFI